MGGIITVPGNLNKEQSKAVFHDGNSAILAGPGSGKTATLVSKIWYLNETAYLAPRSIACLTYNNDCVREIRSRLRSLGVTRRHGLFLGTVHSFCLNMVLRPYATLTLNHFKGGIKVATPGVADMILDQILSEIRPDQNARWYGPSFTSFRRKLACKEDLTGFDDDDPRIYREYVNRLEQAGMVDFEMMVSLALLLIEEHAWIRDLVAARFPWMLVDEYQDLGGPLDRIVTILAEQTDIKIFAVGDPDQTIYQFTGADPIYLTKLSEREDFQTVRLRFNYRSGRRLIGAAEAALAPDEPRGYEPDPDRSDLGEVYFHEANGSIENHAELCVREIIPKLRAEGVPLEQIAILYPRIGKLFYSLVTELSRYNIPFRPERDNVYPHSSLIRWLQECASWSISSAGAPEFSFESLIHPLHDLFVSAGMADQGRPSLATRSKLFNALSEQFNPMMLLRDWINKFESSTNLLNALRSADISADDLESIESLMKDTSDGGRLAGHHLEDFANSGRVEGKVVLTTMHSSKGREFDVVILPGLIEGLMPRRPWDRRTGRHEEPPKPVMGEDRRLFYVGFTRARRMVFLISSESYINDWGYSVDLGVSRFVSEIRDQLAAI